MALTKKALVLVAMMSLLCGVALSSSVHKVGGSAGWTTKGNVDYAKWASSQKFMVGDTLVFDYNKQFHNVMQVSLPDFRSCNVTTPIATYTSGSDSITIKRTGHFYYLCGVPGHCQAGQKVDIRVTQASLAPSPAPTGSPMASPSLALAPTPTTQSNAPFLRSPKILLTLGFVTTLLCFVN